jgi:hypothetical protein
MDFADHADTNESEVLKWRAQLLSSAMIHEDITKDIVGAAMAVLNELRPGLDEKLYERAFVHELNRAIRCEN